MRIAMCAERAREPREDARELALPVERAPTV
jgi:hypothetical protein